MKINMEEFYRFGQRQHKIYQYAQRMRDGRKKPQVRAEMIFLVLVYMVAWGQRHFLQMDKLARKQAVRQFFGSKRPMDGFRLDDGPPLVWVRGDAGAATVGRSVSAPTDPIDAGEGGPEAATVGRHRWQHDGVL